MILGCVYFDKNDHFIPKFSSNLTSKEFDYGFFVFDQKKCLVNRQLLVAKSKGQVKVLNPLDSQFPVGFSSLDTLKKYLEEAHFSYKLSVVILDEEAGQLSLVRDLFGIKPLYYIHIPNIFFAFSSSLTALINLDIVKPHLGINTSHIYNYLRWGTDGDLYSSDTVYKNIKNVHPGKSLLVKSNHISSSNFWVFNPSTLTSSKTKEEIGEEFKTYFKNSVKDSLENSSNIAATLSGGLDSSSICCMIKDIEPVISIHTIYANTNTSLTEEKGFAIDVAEHIRSQHHIITPPTDNLFESSVLHTSLYGHPEYMLNGSSLNRSVIQTALDFRCSTLFSGHAGDAIVGYGGDYIFKLFDEGNWDILRNLISTPIHQNLRYDDDKTEDDLTKDLLFALLLRKKHSISPFKLALLLLKVSSFFRIPIHFFLERGLNKVNTYFSMPSSISSARAEKNRYTAADYQFPLKDGVEDIYSGHYDSVFGMQSVLINEQFYILDNHYGTNHKFPFYDKSLFELCLTVPSKIKYDNGLRRGHFREAMKGVLPENVRTRTSKANFGFYGRITALKLYKQSLDILSANNNVWDFVEKSKFDKCVGILTKDNLPVHFYNKVNYFVTKTIYLAIWLDLIKRDGFISGLEYQK